MASKSKYLEDLITGKYNENSVTQIDKILGTNRYINTNTISYSILDSLTSSTNTYSAGDAWLNALDVYTKNTAQKVQDTTLIRRKQFTSDLQSLPTVINNVSDSYLSSYHGQLPAKYIECLITTSSGKSIPVLFPKSFSRSISASFAKQNPVGSNHAIMAYAYTDSETIPIEFDCLSDYLPSGYTSLQAYIDDIMSILKPTYKNDNVVKEPRLTLQFGNFVIKCVCTSVSVNYDILFDHKYFSHAVVSAQFITIQ